MVVRHCVARNRGWMGRWLMSVLVFNLLMEKNIYVKVMM